ncbi:MAG: acylphosphatase [Methanothrix sp.]|nr:acylphosphatase [Methanothrix sp.]
MRRLTAFISGTVQKTGYRAKVVNLANFLGLNGFVQNLPDNRVKVVAEGDESALERFINDLRIKDSLIDVHGIEINYTSAMGDFIRFEKMVAEGETDQRLDKAAELLSDLIIVNKQIVAQLIINNEEIKGVREEVKGSREDIRSVYEEVKGVREEVKGSREDIRSVYEEVKGVREEVKGSREDIRSVYEEVKGVREEVKGSREDINKSIQDVRQEVNSVGEMIAEKIDDAREEIAGEVKELHSDLKDDLKERLVRMEADISQIKARIGL